VDVLYCDRKVRFKHSKREEIVKNSENTMFYNLVLRNQSLSQPYNSSDKLPSFIIKELAQFLRKPFVFEVANAELIGPGCWI